jgi:hypothetical protein
VKTGHTLGAGYVEVGAGRKKGVQLISAVLGAPSEAERDSESLALLDYGFGLYRVRHPVRAKETLASPSIRYSGGELALRAAHPITAGVRQGERLRTSVRAPGEVTGPIRKGKRLGRVTVTVDGRPAGAAALVATMAVPEASEFDKLRSHALLVLALIALGGSAILVVGLAIRRGMRRALDGDEDSEEGREQRRIIREQRRKEREGSGRLFSPSPSTQRSTARWRCRTSARETDIARSRAAPWRAARGSTSPGRWPGSGAP